MKKAKTLLIFAINLAQNRLVISADGGVKICEFLAFDFKISRSGLNFYHFVGLNFIARGEFSQIAVSVGVFFVPNPAVFVQIKKFPPNSIWCWPENLRAEFAFQIKKLAGFHFLEKSSLGAVLVEIIFFGHYFAPRKNSDASIRALVIS